MPEEKLQGNLGHKGKGSRGLESFRRSLDRSSDLKTEDRALANPKHQDTLRNHSEDAEGLSEVCFREAGGMPGLDSTEASRIVPSSHADCGHFRDERIHYELSGNPGHERTVQCSYLL